MLFFCEECGGRNEATRTDNGPCYPSRCRVCGESLQLQNANQESAASMCSSTPSEAIRVLVVDDSGLMRKAVRRVFEPAEHIHVVGEAENGAVALERLAALRPDVITLDINMPVMDGLTALKHIMIRQPTPTVMFSTLTRAGSATAFRALQFGAVDVMHKPSQVAHSHIEDQHREMIRKVALAADVETGAIRYIRNPKHASGQLLESQRGAAPCDHVITVGAAEGGYGALLKVIPALRADTTGAFLVLLYAPPEHVDEFAAYLNRLSPLTVRRAASGAPLRRGECHIAADGEYITVERRNGIPSLRVASAPFSAHRGSINMMMFSAVEVFGRRASGVVLSGMGNDGEEGMREIIRNGGGAIVQDPRTCLYKEMAWSVIANTAGHQVVADGDLPIHINAQIDAVSSDTDPKKYQVTALR